MIWRSTLWIGTLVVLSVLIELTVLAPIPFWGATPPLTLVVVAAVAFTFGPVTAAITGFAAGLLLDLAPPAAGIIGVSALLLTIVGYALGRVFASDDRPLILTTAFTAIAGGLFVVAAAAVGGLVGDPRVRWEEVPSMSVAAFVYAGLLALPLVPFVRRVSRQVVPEVFPR